MEIIKNFRENDALRTSFNALAGKTFGLNFESWYQAGYWTDNYIPYCAVENGEVIANVSANRTDMRIGGKVRKLIQLGTVMTAEEHRNRGLIRAIMAEIDKDFHDADGVYLFGSDSVVEFYPKFGFAIGKEYICSRDTEQTGAYEMERVLMDTPEKRNILRAAMENSRFKTACTMVNNPELVFFYVYQFMQDCVYYSKKLDAWVIAEQEEKSLFIHNVFGGESLMLDDVIAAFGSGVKRVTLGFSPADTAGWEQSEWHREDCTFFVRGGAVELFEANKLRIPELSHA